MSRVRASRFHDISCGHRVYGHEGKCRHFHGHNYRIHFDIEAKELDTVGRVLDFSVIKSRLCEWLERTWDHRMLLWQDDPDAFTMCDLDPDGVVLLPFNPTAENMATYLLDWIGPQELVGLGVTLTSVRIEETYKCHAEVSL